MHKKYRVAIVGAASIAGAEILQVVEERLFPVEELLLFDAAEVEGDSLEYDGESIMIQPLGEEAFQGVDLVLFATDVELSRTFCPIAAAAGAVCIDSSAAWRMDPDVPLVASEINPQDMALYVRKRIVAAPGSAAIQLAGLLKPLHDHSPLRRVVVSAFQPVSGTGQQAIDELRVQAGELLNGRPATSKVYPHQVAFNCLPQVGVFLQNGYTSEEMLLVDETRKLLGEPSLRITSTAVRVPVFYGQSAAVNVETEGRIGLALARELLKGAPGLEVVDEPDNNDYPMPIDAAGQDAIFVGRIREDDSVENGLNLWVVSDNLRKGVGINVVQIAELLIATYL